MIIAEQLTKEQIVIQAEINSNIVEGMSFEKYAKTPQERLALKEAKEMWKAGQANA